MNSPTNLTDRLSHLRERNGDTAAISGNRPNEPQTASPRKAKRERRFATDYFMLFAYSLLSIAVVCQIILIAWLDII